MSEMIRAIVAAKTAGLLSARERVLPEAHCPDSPSAAVSEADWRPPAALSDKGAAPPPPRRHQSPEALSPRLGPRRANYQS